jgi:hypothetical protein
VERLNQWMTLVANIGVVAGLMFLGYEIQANTAALRSDTYQGFIEASFSFADTTMQYAKELTAMEQKDFEELSLEEQRIFTGYALKTFATIESSFLHHRAGSLDDDVFEARMAGSTGLFLRNRLLMDAWERRVISSTPEFREYMDKRIKATGSSSTER